MVGLSGLVPYGLVAVGFPFTVGSVMSALAPAARSSRAYMMPPCAPTSSSAACTASVACANGGSSGKSRPKCVLLAGAPGGSPCRAASLTGAAAAAVPPISSPPDAAASPAPAVPAPASSLRREIPGRPPSSLMVVTLLSRHQQARASPRGPYARPHRPPHSYGEST